ncbi:ABC transporter permease [Neolewinella antarctica]|uniref:ABC transport system permease protein n=1 Tax=Neolewinella antarctica TaxID=442734 RepID=A0ABX0X723_9BACT|nr:FtsX-like permease family protein [Neolewinella antarctica]NJC25001.1 putative ABC transport system permease protein [Neolewinella antarctica]
MNILSLAFRNLWYKPLTALLSVLLFALSIGLIALLLNLRAQADDQFDNNLAGINLVVGAKGSPLELVLNSMYHVGYPNGNIPLGKVKAFFNPQHPIVEAAVPLSLGDSYLGYRIVGTTADLIDWYGGVLVEGKAFAKDFEAVVGEEVARKNGLRIGSTFRSSHGIIDEGADRVEHDGEFVVTGVLAASGTVLDQIVLTTNQTYWHSHEAHDAEGGHAGHDHDHAAHDHDHDHAEVTTLMEEDPEKEITSILVRYKNPSSFQALSFPRNINENTDLLAANPAYEISEVRRQFDTGQRLLGVLVVAITIVSALSIFISLFTSLRERRYELALLRVLGAGRPRLFALIVAEGLIVAVIGYGLGILLAHAILTLLAADISGEFRYSLDAWRFLPEEFWLLAGAVLLGLVAAIIPAIQAARTDIGETLTGEG